MRKERLFAIVRRLNVMFLVSAALSIFVFLATLAWDVLENVLEPRRRARESGR